MNFVRDDVIYLAAFMDAEGSFGIQHNKNGSYHTSMQVSNTNKAVLEWVESKFDGYLYPTGVPKDDHRQSWQLYWRTREMLELIPVLLPFLKIKKKQAETLWKYLNCYSMAVFKMRVYTQEEIDHRKALFNRMYELNHPGMYHV